MNVEFALKVPVKPACYDSKPACLCKLCHMYDVRMSTRMPIAKPVPCRSVAKSTSGLASIGGSCVRSAPVADPVVKPRPFGSLAGRPLSKIPVRVVVSRAWTIDEIDNR